MKKTEFKDKNKYKGGEFIFVFCLCLFLFLFLVFGIILTKVFDDLIGKTICFSAVFLIIGIFGSIFIGMLYGKIRTRIKENGIEKEIKSNNPYIYYRELPNNYGIGISSILINKTIENEKDIVACILDLCARKYLKLEKVGDKYTITILKKSTDDLLNNETYILKHLINNTIQQIDYQEWYQLCFEDGKQLGLFEDIEEVYRSESEQKVRTENFYKTNEYQLKKIVPIILLISVILGIIVYIFPNIAKVISNSLYINNSIKVISSITVMIFSFMLLITIYTYSRLIHFVAKSTYQDRDIIYQNVLSTKIIHTLKGQDATKKLNSFKNFLKDFGLFAEKNTNEIIIWDEYLSFAILFGLTDEILKTGYKQLVENSSFKIDNVDNINLQDISVNSI